MGSLRTLEDPRAEVGLRKVSKRVKKFGTNELKLLQQTMLYEALRYEREHPDQLCFGLAAPQVGVNLRVIMVRNGRDPHEQSWTFMFNPRYVESVGGFQREVEGCLSVPGITGEAIRPEESHFYYFDEKGERVPKAEDKYIRAIDDYARVICHELDHLNGVLFCDNVVHLNKSQKAMVDDVTEDGDDE